VNYVVKVTKSSKTHKHFSLFVNGGYAGKLTLRSEEFDDFVEKLGAEVTGL